MLPHDADDGLLVHLKLDLNATMTIYLVFRRNLNNFGYELFVDRGLLVFTVERGTTLAELFARAVFVDIREARSPFFTVRRISSLNVLSTYFLI